MTVLITGGAGFIAATLVQRLLDRGEVVLAIDNLCRGSVANLPSFGKRSQLLFAKADLADLAAFRSAIAAHRHLGRIDAVWHLAANSDIPAGIADASLDLRDTFMTTYNTLRVMEENGIRKLLFASSSAIYGDLGETALSEETGPLFPISNYGAMKLASEAAITAAAEKFLDRALIFRFPNVVGVPATHGVILDFVRRLRCQPDRLDVFGDGTQRKSYLHVSDLVDAVLLVASHASRKVDVFNIGPVDDGITVRQIATETVAAAAPGATVSFGSGNKGWIGDVPSFRYSVAKLKELGWQPRLDSVGAVRRAIAEIMRQEGGAAGDCRE